MFTGIVEKGVVSAMQPKGEGLIITIHYPHMDKGLKHGDSVAIDGACLSIIEKNQEGFSFFATSETIHKTIIQSYTPGSIVNVEFPLRPMDFLGGHHVLGHVDTSGKVVSVDKTEEFWFVDIEIPEHFSQYVVYKGSIAVNGVSLTINKVHDNSINLCLIPVTLEKSSLGKLDSGMLVNLEFDILAKYTERILTKKSSADV